jgi:hypothetical protein
MFALFRRAFVSHLQTLSTQRPLFRHGVSRTKETMKMATSKGGGEGSIYQRSSEYRWLGVLSI